MLIGISTIRTHQLEMTEKGKNLNVLGGHRMSMIQ